MTKAQKSQVMARIPIVPLDDSQDDLDAIAAAIAEVTCEAVTVAHGEFCAWAAGFHARAGAGYSGVN